MKETNFASLHIAGAVITIDESDPNHAQVLFFCPQMHQTKATEQAIRSVTGIDLYVSQITDMMYDCAASSAAGLHW